MKRLTKRALAISLIAGLVGGIAGFVAGLAGIGSPVSGAITLFLVGFLTNIVSALLRGSSPRRG